MEERIKMRIITDEEKERRVFFVKEYFRTHVYGSSKTLAYYYNKLYDTNISGQCFNRVIRNLKEEGVLENYRRALFISKIFKQEA